MSKFDEFDTHIEQFKIVHSKSPVNQGPPITAGDGQVPDEGLMSDFIYNVLSRSKKPVDIRIYDYGLDTPFRIANINDTVLQYVAFNLKDNQFIFWTDAEPDGMHPAKAMARVFELEGLEVECDVDASGQSSMTLYHNGKITRIKDNHDHGDRQITIDGKGLNANPSLSEDD